VTIPPGHDAWTVGTEPCIMLDFAGFADYAMSARELRERPGQDAHPH
jgi:hypothetical protein